MSRELLQQALDALLTGYHQGTQDAIAALREALAADHLRDVAEKAAPAAPVVPLTDDMVKAEFVSRGDDKGQGLHPYWKDAFSEGFNFARSQLSAAPVVPLTDEQLARIAVEDEFLLYCDQDSFNEIARAVEQAHGIGGGGK